MTDMVDPQVQQALDQMADYIEEHGWCQNNFEDLSGAVCLYGALYKAVPWVTMLRINAIAEIHSRIGSCGNGIMTWNDATWQTKDRVIRMLRGKSLDE